MRPRTGLAEDAGIELGGTGAIATDAYRETNLPGVYAAGDCAEAGHVVTGEPAYVPRALTANRRGRAIGQTVQCRPEPEGDERGANPGSGATYRLPWPGTGRGWGCESLR